MLDQGQLAAVPGIWGPAAAGAVARADRILRPHYEIIRPALVRPSFARALAYVKARLARPLEIRDLLVLQGAVFGSKSYVRKVRNTNPIAYWVLDESSGTAALCRILAAQNGQHTGVTLGQPGIGGRTCPFYDGANDYTNVQTATLAGRFNGAEGTLMVWAKVANAGVWIDGTPRLLCCLFTDASNLIQLFKSTAANTITWRFRAVGDTDDISRAGMVTTDWFNMTLTWSDAADQAIAYYNGAQEGAPRTPIGTWAGALASSFIGSYAPPGLLWHGWEAHCAIWDRALAPATAQKLATV